MRESVNGTSLARTRVQEFGFWFAVGKCLFRSFPSWWPLHGGASFKHRIQHFV